MKMPVGVSDWQWDYEDASGIMKMPVGLSYCHEYCSYAVTFNFTIFFYH